MSNCCKGACWCKYLPHNWLCLKGLSIAFVVLFYITLIVGVVVASILCINVWGMFKDYFGQPSAKELLAMGSLWAAWGAVLLQVIVAVVPLSLGWLTMSKILKTLAKIKHAVAPCCCHEEKADEKPAKKADKKEAK